MTRGVISDGRAFFALISRRSVSGPGRLHSLSRNVGEEDARLNLFVKTGTTTSTAGHELIA